jgi:dual-specificity kinase
MQTAVQYSAPSLLPQYAHPTLSLNRGVNGNPNAMPTPPVPTRKRKRPRQYTVNYSEVQEVDNSGKLREVIVIDDTPPPSTVSPATTHNHLYSASYQPPVYSAPVRTRARAAAEAQQLSASTSAQVAPPPPPKKRKRDPVDVAGTVAKRPTAVNGHLQNISSSNKSWASGSGQTLDDVSPASISSVTVAPYCPAFYRRRALNLAMIRKDII